MFANSCRSSRSLEKRPGSYGTDRYGNGECPANIDTKGARTGTKRDWECGVADNEQDIEIRSLPLYTQLNDEEQNGVNSQRSPTKEYVSSKEDGIQSHRITTNLWEEHASGFRRYLAVDVGYWCSP